MDGLTVRRWLVTGASSGLGRAIVEAALARGDKVAATVRRPDQAAGIEAPAPGSAFAQVIDLAETEAIEAMVDRAAGQLGGLDVLVNNAGFALAGAVEELGLAEVRAAFEVNVFAPLALARSALPHMRAAGGGRILNIASLAALESYRGLGAYSATKAALAAFSEAVDIEARAFGIRSTSVEPAGLRTCFAGSSLRKATRVLPPYEAMRAEMDAAFARSDGRQANDPAKAAAALLALVDLADPPAHFLVGAGAFERVEALLARRLTEYAEHQALGSATAID